MGTKRNLSAPNVAPSRWSRTWDDWWLRFIIYIGSCMGLLLGSLALMVYMYSAPSPLATPLDHLGVDDFFLPRGRRGGVSPQHYHCASTQKLISGGVCVCCSCALRWACGAAHFFEWRFWW